MARLKMLFVVVKGDPYAGEDEHVPGVYAVEVDTNLVDGQAACAALEAFHRHIGIEEVDAFEIAVLDADGRSIPDDEHCPGVDAVFLGRVENDSTPPPSSGDFGKIVGNAGR